MAISKRELNRCLKQKFDFQEVPGSRHEALSLIVDGRKVATVRFSRSHKEISNTILRLIARECWVQTSYLKGMISCDISQEAYMAYLLDDGYLS